MFDSFYKRSTSCCCTDSVVALIYFDKEQQFKQLAVSNIVISNNNMMLLQHGEGMIYYLELYVLIFLWIRLWYIYRDLPERIACTVAAVADTFFLIYPYWCCCEDVYNTFTGTVLEWVKVVCTSVLEWVEVVCTFPILMSVLTLLRRCLWYLYRDFFGFWRTLDQFWLLILVLVL